LSYEIKIPSETNINQEYIGVAMLLRSIGLGEFPKNSVLLIEEDLGGIKTIFLQLLVLDSLKNGKRVMYISTRRSEEDILEEIELVGYRVKREIKDLTILGDFKNRESLVEICNALSSAPTDARHVDICVVDTFSTLFMEESLSNLSADMNLLLNTARKCNISFFLATDMGILKEREERFLRSMTDGIIQFRTEYVGGKINRFINIPKMKGVPPHNKMIPFKINEGGIVADTRERIG